MNPPIDERQPWPGLESWTEADSKIFAGREAEIVELLKLVRREVLTVVFGPSGTGKTSLLQAGLTPRLRQTAYLPVSIRLDHSEPHPDYIAQARSLLDRAIASHALETEKRAPLPASVTEPASTLWEFLYGLALWDSRNELITPVLIFDQFEEIFTLAKDVEAARAFLEELADLVENYLPSRVRAQLEKQSETIPISGGETVCRVTLSLREDLVWHLDALRKAMPSVMHNRFLVSRMNTSQALLAVTGPGAGIVDESVGAQIVRFVAAENAQRTQKAQVDPSLLSVVCRELNSRRIERGKVAITVDLLEESSSGILLDFYERGFAGLDPMARVFIEDRLVTPSGFRGTVPVEEALRAGFRAETVQALENRRLIRVEERLGIPHMELTHDVLTGVVQKSRAERQERERADREKQLREQEQQKAREQDARRVSELKGARRLLIIVGSAAAACLVFALLAFLSYRSSVAARYLSIFQRVTFEAPRQQMENANDDLAALLFMEAPSLAAKLSNPPDLRSDYSIFAYPEFRHLLGTHERRVTSISYSPDGRLLASASEDGAIRIWDLKSPSVPRDSLSSGSAVEAVAFGPDGKTLASAGAEDFILLWNLQEPRAEPTRLDGPKGGSWALAFSKAGLIAAAGRDGTIRIWNVAGRQSSRIMIDKPVWIHSVAFNSDGTKLATGSEDGMVRIWDMQNLAHDPLKLKGHQSDVFSVAFGPDSQLASASEDKTVRIWHLDTGKVQVFGDCDAQSTSVGFDPAGRRLAAGCGDRTIKIWDLDREAAGPASLAGHHKSISAVAFDPNPAEDRIASGGLDGEVRVWEMKRKPGAPVVFRQDYIGSLIFTPDGRLLSGGRDLNRVSALLWDPRNPSGPPIEFAGARGHITKGTIRSVAVSSDGKLVATGGIDGIARVWEIGNPAREMDFRVNNKINGVGFSPDSTILAASADDGVMRFWKIDHPGSPIATVSGASGPAFRPDGRYAASSDQAGRILIWDISRIYASRGAKPGPVSPSGFGNDVILSFSVDWKKAATQTRTGQIRIWNVHETDASPLTADGPPFVLPDQVDTEEVGATFSPDGTMLVAGGSDRVARFWNLNRPGDHAMVLKGFQNSLSGVAFSNDNSLLATGTADGLVRIWSLPATSERDMVCRLVWRNLTQQEWDFFIGTGIPYDATCNPPHGTDGN